MLTLDARDDDEFNDDAADADTPRLPRVRLDSLCHRNLFARLTQAFSAMLKSRSLPPADLVGERLAELGGHWRTVSWLTMMPRCLSRRRHFRRALRHDLRNSQ